MSIRWSKSVDVPVLIVIDEWDDEATQGWFMDKSKTDQDYERAKKQRFAIKRETISHMYNMKVEEYGLYQPPERIVAVFGANELARAQEYVERLNSARRMKDTDDFVQREFDPDFIKESIKESILKVLNKGKRYF